MCMGLVAVYRLAHRHAGCAGKLQYYSEGTQTPVCLIERPKEQMGKQ